MDLGRVGCILHLLENAILAYIFPITPSSQNSTDTSDLCMLDGESSNWFSTTNDKVSAWSCALQDALQCNTH